MPLAQADVQQLRVGDFAYLSGTVFTARDAVHKYLAAGNTVPCDLHHATLYHCGPIVVTDNGEFRIAAAGPTTSAREEPYMSGLIARFGLRGIIGKGGMGRETLNACRQHGCVYFHAVGGAAQILAACVKRVAGVHLKEEFGSPEALWELEVARFPVVVTMDAHGNSLHAATDEHSHRKLQELIRKKTGTAPNE